MAAGEAGPRPVCRLSGTNQAANLINEGEARMKYLEAIKAADNGDIQLLLKFARS
jgi:hypothetical protein